MLVFNFNKDFQSKFIWIDSHCENYGKAYSLSGMAGNLVTELHCKSNADFHLSEDKMSKETRICYSFIRLQKKKRDDLGVKILVYRSNYFAPWSTVGFSCDLGKSTSVCICIFSYVKHGWCFSISKISFLRHLLKQHPDAAIMGDIVNG